jgi:L-lactate dehydrogenase (cytochrome)
MTSPTVESGVPETADQSSLERAKQSAGLPRSFRDLLALDDFDRHAKRVLPPMIYKYVDGGVETESAVRMAREAYTRYAFLPRMFVNVAGREQTVSLFGHEYAHPFGIPPLGGSAFITYRGDLRYAAAARRANIPMILSASSLIRLEDVIAENKNAWFQAYLAGDQPRIDRLIDRVAGAGYQTLVVTGDTPMLGNREHNIRSGFSMPIKMSPTVMWQSATHPRWFLGTVARTFIKHGAPHFENTDAERGPPMMSRKVRNTLKRDELAWHHLEAIRKRWKGNLVVKGLVTPADVRIAQSCGADGVILSNHGGRQLDYVVPPLDTLEEVVSFKGDMKVMIDSGIRRGTDIMKAMALGADFVFIGRPFVYAAVLGGEAGVLHAVNLMKEEIDRDMAFLGVRQLQELSPVLLRRILPKE